MKFRRYAVVTLSEFEKLTFLARRKLKFLTKRKSLFLIFSMILLFSGLLLYIQANRYTRIKEYPKYGIAAFSSLASIEVEYSVMTFKTVDVEKDVINASLWYSFKPTEPSFIFGIQLPQSIAEPVGYSVTVYNNTRIPKHLVFLSNSSKCTVKYISDGDVTLIYLNVDTNSTPTMYVK